jgi:hypothetical protein
MNENPPPADPSDRVMRIPPVGAPHREEALLDQAVAETFPASDPISPAVAERMEPADVQWNEKSTRSSARFTDRLRRNAPALIAIGTAAVALLALRALRGDRHPTDDADAEYFEH